MRSILWSLLALAFALAIGPSGRADDLPRALPDQVGVSSTKLERTKAVVQAAIDKHETAGAIVAVARHGKVVELEALGQMDIERGKAMRPDTIFRIYSMSKPITTVAAMILVEEGRIGLDDPVSKYLPELKDLKVASGKNGTTEPAKREMTVRELMRHTSGLTYGAFGSTNVDKLYRDQGILNPNHTLAEMVTKLSKLPLLYQPGTRFNYSVSTDVLGRVVEVVSGKPLDEFFQERIFGPLEMKDTAFWVPAGKRERFAANYGPADKGGLKVIDDPAKSPYLKRPALLLGGGGLVSTARDYLRFCQMVANGGALNGTRLLKATTVAEMTRNQLPAEAMPLTLVVPRAGVGFGLGFQVRVAPDKNDPGVVDEYGWGGAASTHFWIAPKQDLIVVILQQYMPFNSKLETALKPIIYEAIAD